MGLTRRGALEAHEARHPKSKKRRVLNEAELQA
jgi:hypothetical protein